MGWSGKEEQEDGIIDNHWGRMQWHLQEMNILKQILGEVSFLRAMGPAFGPLILLTSEYTNE